jgi:protein involved in polysaccharide export with SLBB domain
MLSFSALPQSLEDISSLKVDDLTDQQLQKLVERASQAGFSEAELFQMAQLRGVPASEIAKLKDRLSGLVIMDASGSGNASGSVNRSPRRQMGFNEIIRGMIPPENDLEKMTTNTADSPYFGMELFYSKSRRLTFEPNLNMATPKSYILGPGDEVYIDIYGQSETYYEAPVSSEGQILLENIGPISVSGMSLREATEVIRNRLSSFYTGLKGSNPNTFLQVNLGNVRTIKVNLVGEIRLPGTFTLSAFSNVFNALYAAGGPNANGSMRKVKLIRNQKEIAEIDIYNFLMNGDTGVNITLQDQDIILVPPYLSRVRMEGAVKRPKIFEVKENETFADVLHYAGGFTDNAYREKVGVTRVTATEKAVSDVYNEQFSMFLVKGGDHYIIGEILDRYTNRVQVKGAVYRPGNYAYQEGLMLTELIDKSEGLSGDAFLKRVTILRTDDDLSNRLIQVDLGEINQGLAPDIPIMREDVVHVPSIYEIKEEVYVKVSGEVLYPGTYAYAQDMTSEDLILMAGGLKESASKEDIELARRVTDQEGREFAEIIPVSMGEDLGLSANPTTLLPFDHLTVRRKTNFSLERVAEIEGQVNAPGSFTISHAEERISSLVKRAGGLTAFAFPEGATLIRRTEFFKRQSEKARKEKSLLNLLERLNRENAEPTESQKQMIDRINQYLFGGNDSTETQLDQTIVNARETLLNDISSSREGVNPIKIRETEAIAIDLRAILENPGSEYDLIIEEGDILSIPRELQTVRLRGDVIYPTTIRHEDFRGLSYYINKAGGFNVRAKKKRTYVVYANGEVARTKSFLFFNFYPKIAPGSEIIVPTKGPRIPVRPGDLVGITTGLATLALVFTQIFN